MNPYLIWTIVIILIAALAWAVYFASVRILPSLPQQTSQDIILLVAILASVLGVISSIIQIFLALPKTKGVKVYKPPRFRKGKLEPVRPLPPGSLVPYDTNALFTGRQTNLLALASYLLAAQEDEMLPPLVVSGMGGLGKTQLAVEFCHRYGAAFHGVHWIRAAQKEDIEAGIAACGQEMQLQPWPDSLPERAACTRHAWQQPGLRLIILDDVHDPAVLSDFIASLRYPHIRLLVTARPLAWPATTRISLYPLPLFPRPDSLKLLRSLSARLKKLPDHDLAPLAVRLGDLPLALHLAGLALEHDSTLTPGAYLEKLESTGGLLKGQPMLASFPETPTHHTLDHQATFQVSWEMLKESDPLDAIARRLFRMAGYLAPDVIIPEELLGLAILNDQGILPVEGEIEDKQIEEANSSYQQAMDRLLTLGFLSPGPMLHPLLAEFARLQDGTSAASSLPALAQALARIAYQANMTGLPQRFLPLRPHLPLLASAAESAGLADAGALWVNYGYHLKMIADYAGARDCYERALRIGEAAYGPNHPEVAMNVNNLGRVLHALGDLRGARDCFERALRIDEAAYGPDHPDVAIFVNNLGLVLQDLGDLSGACDCFERALRIDEAAIGANHLQVAKFVNNLGGGLYELGDLSGARACFERALRIDEAAFGLDHPNVATDVNNLGRVLQDLGDLEGARECYERALRIDEATYGSDHPKVAIRVNNLGGVQYDLGDLQGARAYLERALRIDEAADGPDHPNVAKRVNNLGGVLRAQGDLAGARAYFERALRIDEAAFGPDHLDVATDVSNLGVVLHELGDLAGARACFERALRIREVSLGKDHPKT